MRRTVLAVALTALLVLAGCSGFGGGDGTAGPTPDEGTPRPTDATETEQTTSDRPTDGGDGVPRDPAEDRIGWEGGYWYNESIDVDASDGLTDAEFERVKYRTMARVERIRDREFRRDVAFEFVTLEEFRASSPFAFSEDAGRDIYWEAALVVGDDTTSAAALSDLYDVVVDGYYTPRRIVVVVDDPEAPRLGSGVVAHELAHALDYQTVPNRERPSNRDQREAARAVGEGSANLVETMYRQRCAEAWDCIDQPESAERDYDDDRVLDGLYVRFSMAYSVGEAFVAELYDRGGWDAVDRALAEPPASTEQIVHPERYPDDAPRDVTVPDRSVADWEQLGAWTFGETTLYAALYHNDAIDAPDVEITEAQRTGLPYTAPAVDGWDGDRVVPYTNGSATGYVFVSAWDTPDDASEFRAAYVSMLTEKGAREVREGIYRIAEGPFAGAYRIDRAGDRLTVVHAPSVAALSAVHDGNESAATTHPGLA